MNRFSWQTNTYTSTLVHLHIQPLHIPFRHLGGSVAQSLGVKLQVALQPQQLVVAVRVVVVVDGFYTCGSSVNELQVNVKYIDNKHTKHTSTTYWNTRAHAHTTYWKVRTYTYKDLYRSLKHTERENIYKHIPARVYTKTIPALHLSFRFHGYLRIRRNGFRCRRPGGWERHTHSRWNSPLLVAGWKEQHKTWALQKKR